MGRGEAEEGDDEMRLAFMTFAVMAGPWGDERVAGFQERLPATFGAAESSPGFVARSKLEGWIEGLPEADQDWGAWGPYRRTAFYPDGGGSAGDQEAGDHEASTLSVWADLESVYAFAYGGPHLEALRHRGEWFTERRWPSYVAWWVGDDETPSWADAAERLEHLHANGSTPYAFDFHQPFEADGSARSRPTVVRR